MFLKKLFLKKEDNPDYENSLINNGVRSFDNIL